MPEIAVNFSERSYVVMVGCGVLASVGERLASIAKPSGVVVVTNPVVGRLYAETVERSITAAGLRVSRITIPAGERFKTMRTLGKVLNSMVEAGADRKSAVVALGGGVVGDIAGFAAAVYMRGMKVVQVPTTLLAMVDASVGGKTGVDLPTGKNLVGAFHQPSLVVADIDTLRTLPSREVRAGLAEVAKHGIIFDQRLFEYTIVNAKSLLWRDAEALAHVVTRSVEIKREVVQQDERESGIRAILNYGHTVGHAIESLTGYSEYRHGEAVAIGMVAEARLAERIGIAEQGLAASVTAAVHALKLPSQPPAGIAARDIVTAMGRDKKTMGGVLRFALPDKIGHCRIIDGVEPDVVTAAIEDCRK